VRIFRENFFQKSRIKPIAFHPLFIAIPLYLSLITSLGTHNRSYYISWIKSFLAGDILTLYHTENLEKYVNLNDLTVPYPPFSLYIISLICIPLIHFFGDTDQIYVIAVNLTGVAFSVFTVILFGKFERKSLTQTSYSYLLIPAVILISPILGFQDTIFSFFVILAILYISKSKFLLAGAFTGCAILSKQLALIPMFGVIFVLFMQQSKMRIVQFLMGLTCSVALILSPFLVNGRIISYLESQSLTSIHTMLSAQASNFPWLISLITRFMTLDFSDAIILNGNGLRITNETARQFSYLTAGSIVFISFFIWMIYWSKKIGRKNVSPIYAAGVVVCAYHLFNFGVHENHVFMLIPILYLIKEQKNIKRALYCASTALALQLVIVASFGDSFQPIRPIISVYPILYILLSICCIVLFVLAFYWLTVSNPRSHFRETTGK
jgi:hypothetical protein